jgi:hypothetical protein
LEKIRYETEIVGENFEKKEKTGERKNTKNVGIKFWER